jgi:hypothetical protein
MDFVANSTPIVDLESKVNSFRVNLVRTVGEADLNKVMRGNYRWQERTIGFSDSGFSN